MCVTCASNRIREHFRSARVPNLNHTRLWNSLKMPWKAHVADGEYCWFEDSKQNSKTTAMLITIETRGTLLPATNRYLFFFHRRPEHGPMRVQLTNPVSRFKHIQSLQHMCRYVLAFETNSIESTKHISFRLKHP